MKTHILGAALALAMLFGPATTPVAAAEPPPDIASYRIEAAYDPVSHTITASETATYVNRTDVAIPDLVLHLYLNAFRSDDTLWMREAGPGHRGFSADDAHPGWSRIKSMRLSDGTPLDWEPIDADATLIRVELDAPVPPGDEISIELAFEAQLPRIAARTGWAADGDFVMAGQWFPKFGVWEGSASDAEVGMWNAYPFHANSEFFADFGAYDVTVTLPQGWRIAGTGAQVGVPLTNDDRTVTHAFHADHVIDFAWSASPLFRTLTRQAGDVTITLVYPRGQRSMARRAMVATLEALELYGSWYGPYGQGLYDTLTVVVVPPDAGGAGGMEYPTLFTVGAYAGAGMPRCIRILEVEVVHELAHQWFQTMVATNEAEEPWLDEGFADYSTARAMRELTGGDVVTCGGWTLSYLGMQRMSYIAMPRSPMAGRAWDFGAMDYGIATYAKPVVALSTLERLVGDDAMIAFLRAYVDAYAFKHPGAEDVRTVMVDTLGEDHAAWFFDGAVGTADTLDARATPTNTGTSAATREGNLCVPVPVQVTTAEGTTSIAWPCDGPLEIDGDWLTVEIDPDRTNLLDPNLANNVAQARTAWAPVLGAWVRTIRALQSPFAGGWLR